MDNGNDGELMAVDESTAPIIPNQTEQFDLVDIEGAAAYMENYQEAIKALLTSEDYQTIQNKDFKKKSAWRKLAAAFRISDEIIDEKLIYDDDDQIVRARYRVRCTLPNGRSAEAIGVCSIFDKIRYHSNNPQKPADEETPSNFKLRGRFSTAEHDVPSTAHSRAKNRAISDLIGAGEVSAEELNEPRRVQRTSRGNDDSEAQSNNNSNSNSNGNGRRRRRARKADDDVIETNVIEEVAEVVHDEDDEKSSSSKKSLKDLEKESVAIKKAIDRMKDEGATITKAGVADELFKLFDLGKITLDEFDEGNELLNNN